jgi:hypothetical protein
MDSTISYDEVAAPVGINIPTLEPPLILNAFVLFVGTLNVPYNASHALRAFNTVGKVW